MADKSESEIAIKLEIREKIESGEYILTEQEKKLSTKSVCWKSFKVIKEATTNTAIGYVRCSLCKSISKYNSQRTGTSHLLKHLDRYCDKGISMSVSKTSKGKAAAASSNKIGKYFQKATVTMQMKKQITKAVVKMCSLDMRPFEMVKGLGFESFCEALMEIIATHGPLDIKTLLPHPTTVSRNLKETADELRRTLIPTFVKMIKEGFCAATTDMWTDDFKKISYTTVTLHYTDSDWALVRRVLFTCSYPEEKKKTAANIQEELISKFTSLGFNINDIQRNVVFVTDQGTNIVKALEEPFKRMNCCAHILNTVLRNIFKPKTISKDVPQIHKTFIATKALVAFLKHSGLSSRLKSTVVQEVETRWNSRLLMLKSVYTNYNEIGQVLRDGQHDMERLHSIRLPILKILIDFLQPFKTASDALESDYSTVNCVLPEFNELLFFCKPTTATEPDETSELSESDDDQSEELMHSDSTQQSDMATTSHVRTGDIMQYLKKQAYHFLKRKFLITDNHKLATLLTPISKNLGLHEKSNYPGISLQEREKVIEHLRLTVLAETVLVETREDFAFIDSESVASQSATQSQTQSQSREILSDDSNQVPSCSGSEHVPKKKIRIGASSSQRLKFLMAKALPDPVAPVAQPDDEVDRYLKIPCDSKTDSDALNWWRNHTGEFPILSKIARKLLCIPASSASSERVFSAAGYVVQERRSCLLPETVDSILFLNSNLDVEQKTFAGRIDTTDDNSEVEDSEVYESD